jgi:hypothetical protein
MVVKNGVEKASAATFLPPLAHGGVMAGGWLRALPTLVASAALAFPPHHSHFT